jgi:hypothetical protein
LEPDEVSLLELLLDFFFAHLILIHGLLLLKHALSKINRFTFFLLACIQVETFFNSSHLALWCFI